MRCRRISLGLFPAVVGFGVFACGGSDDSRNTTTLQDWTPKNYGIPVAGCEHNITSGCEITEASCQQSVFALVKCVRKSPDGNIPPVTTITADEYREQLTQGSGANSADSRIQENALLMLGLASPGDLTVANQADVLVSTVGAYYTSEEKKVYVIRPDIPPTLAQRQLQTLTLAHEFVHALQDEAYDLKRYASENSNTYDSTLAASSVVEGEAILYETMLRVAFDGLSPDQVNSTARFANAAAYIETAYASESPVLIAPRLFPYFYGGPYVDLELRANGQSGVDALFASPPPVTLPYILSRERLVETQLSPVTEAGPEPVSGSILYQEDSLGAWLTYEYLKRASGVALTPQDAVSGWRGDHVWVYSDSDTSITSNVAIVWRVRFATSSEVDNFITRTNAATVQSPSNATASRHAFVVNGDAVVVAVTGKFDRVEWEKAVVATGGVSPASPSTADAGSAAPASASFVRSIMKPEPKRVRR